jgi:hypothetical protein
VVCVVLGQGLDEKLKATGVTSAKNRGLPSGAESVIDPVTLSLVVYGAWAIVKSVPV